MKKSIPSPVPIFPFKSMLIYCFSIGAGTFSVFTAFTFEMIHAVNWAAFVYSDKYS